MANNNNLFNAALGGAATGLASRVITSTDPSFYSSQAALVAAFATAFDAQIAPIVGGGSRGQCDVVTDICAGYWRDRVITSTADLTASAQALAAYFTALDTDILPDTGGGGGGTLTPLHGTFWVDATSTETDGTAVGNGTQGAFATITDAATAGAGDDVVSLFIIPGGYATEGTVGFGPTPTLVNLIGVGLNIENSLPNIIAAGQLCCENVQLGDGVDTTVIVANAQGVRGNNCTFAGKIECSNLTADRCVFLGVFVNDPLVQLRQCAFASTVSGIAQDVNGWSMDANTFWSFMLAQIPASDVTTPTISVIEYGNLAYMQDKDMTVDVGTTGGRLNIAVSANVLTAPRVITVDLTSALDKQLVKVYLTGDASVNTVTVNGTVINGAGNYIYTFQNNVGVLSLLSIEYGGENIPLS